MNAPVHHRLMKNLAVGANGGRIAAFTSEYHHKSKVVNLLDRDPSVAWWTDVSQQLPQSVTMELAHSVDLKRVGIYLHGENNQNPKHIKIYASTDAELKNWTCVVDTEVELRPGDHLYDVEAGVAAKYVKYEITENFGGSGIYVTKLYAFGIPSA